MRCEHTLVLHADGTAECDGVHECGCDELVHDLWVSCDELRCGCAGEEHGIEWMWLEAA